MKVYVITAGTYSNYHICAVAIDPVSAENLRLLYSDGWNGEAYIEEFETEERFIRPETCWHITITKDGKLHRCYEKNLAGDGIRVDINRVSYFFVDYDVDVVAKDREHAIKIAQDLIAQYKYERMVEEGETE